MIVLGLDPSLTAYGWAIVDRDAKPAKVLEAGCISTKPARGSKIRSDSRRLAIIASGVLAAIDRSRKPASRVVRVVSEAPTGGKAAKALGQTFGLTVAACEAAGVAATFVTPRAVKVASTGIPDAGKDTVAAGVEKAIGWRSSARTAPQREAETDAVAVALTLPVEALA